MQTLLFILATTTLTLVAACAVLSYRVKVERKQCRAEARARHSMHARVVELERVRGLAKPKPVEARKTAATSGVQPDGRHIVYFGQRTFLKRKLETPETREAMRIQSKEQNRRNHPDLEKEVGLSPQEADYLFDLLAEHHVKSMEASTADDGEIMSAHKCVDRQLETALLTLLNSERYTRYKEYRNTAYERAQVKELRAVLDADNALNDDQAKHLVAILRDERERVNDETIQASRELIRSGQTRREPSVVNPLEEAGLRAREMSAARIRDRAEQVLSAEQCRLLHQLLEARLDVERGVLEYRRTTRQHRPSKTAARGRSHPFSESPEQ